MIHVRVAFHITFLLAFLFLGAFCLLPAGGRLANSIPYLAFVSNLAIVYSAVSALESLHAGRKADPEDPA